MRFKEVTWEEVTVSQVAFLGEKE